MEEMKRLRDKLNELRIAWTDNSDLAIYPIIRTRFEINGVEWSCIYGQGSYGYYQGLLELWDQASDPIGSLTADDVIDITVHGKEV